MTEKLEGCPCCGAEALIRKSSTIYIDEYQVICGNPKGLCGVSTNWYEAESEAIEAWNTRTPSPELAENVRLREALTPSAETKAAYIGEFSIQFPVFDENGEEAMRQISVPWITIKEIMKAISGRAALQQKEG